jgi:DNA-binding HxlR family transcriptional regulator
MRTGAQALALLSVQRNCLVLRALADGPKRQVELRRASGFPAQTTLRGHLKTLEEVGALSKHTREPFPSILEYELEGPGRDLLFVTDVLARWLAAAPEESFELGGNSAKGAIKALVDGWTSTVLDILAGGSHTLTELDNAIALLNYPSIERRLGALRLAGQIQSLSAEARGTPYEVTEWARRAAAPLVAAARWEQRHQADESASVARLDAETAFMLTSPLLRLPSRLSGACRMSVDLPRRGKDVRGGALLIVKDGRVASCTTESPPGRVGCDASTRGEPEAWFGAVIDGDPDGIQSSGDKRLAVGLLEGLHEALFMV